MKTCSALFLFLFFCLVLSSACKKTSVGPLPAGSQYTSKMGGLRTWHGTETYSGYNHILNNETDTTYTINVTDTITIGIITDTSISVRGYVLHFTAFDSVNQDITFYAADGDFTGTLVYGYVSNSMFFSETRHEGADANLADNLQTP